jgi:hypothetical protein
MAKYVCQLRRGTRYVDNNGATLLNPDGTPVRDDWATYTAQAVHVNPLEGELVLEYEEEYDSGKKTPRLKIGDGTSTFAELDYISVDSFILPKQISVTLYGSEDATNATKPQWTEEVDEEGNFLGRYKQVVTVDNAVITPNSKVDLQPESKDLVIFHEKDMAFVAENEDGIVIVYCIGQKPKNTYTIPVTVTEVTTNG